MKIGIHAAFSTIRQVPRRSLPGAPNKSPGLMLWGGNKDTALSPCLEPPYKKRECWRQQGATDLGVHCSAPLEQSAPSYEVTLKQLHAQKRQREVKGASWRSSRQRSLKKNMENHKPLAYGSAADVIDGFIPDVVLAVRQENHNRRPKMHVSLSCKCYGPERSCTFRHSSLSP